MADHPNLAARVLYLLLGGVLLLAGVALLVLPGPGLLLVLSGLILLSHAIPAVRRFVDPMRQRALAAAEESVSSPLRIALSVLTGLALIVAGVVWGLVPTLPLGGWATGSSLILSGFVLLGLLVFSYRRMQVRRSRRGARERAEATPEAPLRPPRRRGR
ncbi:MAG TPA: PGPGW domain-containing protein [Pseudonocardia sp.]|nr:PGPGW domain-containing protein [Pseudonocardia sp.]